MSARKIGFAIAGVASHHSEFVAQAVRDIPDTALIGAFDLDPDRAMRFCQKFETTQYASLQDLLKDSEVQIGVVTSENSLKKEYSIALARAGKHVLCDKPLGISTSESREIRSTCAKAGVTLQVGYISRYTAEAQIAKKFVASGKLGKVQFVDVENRVDTGLVKQLSPWLLKKDFAGGGALIEHAVHAIDLALWLNPTSPVSVFASTASNLDPSYEGEDNFAIVLNFKNGSVALIDGSYCRPRSGKRGDIVVKVSGTTDQLSFTLSSQSLRTYVGSEPHVVEERQSVDIGGSSEKESGLRMIEDLFQSVRGGNRPLADGRVGESVNRVVDACYRSIAMGKECSV